VISENEIKKIFSVIQQGKNLKIDSDGKKIVKTIHFSGENFVFKDLKLCKYTLAFYEIMS